SAGGYLSEEKYLTVKAIQAIEPVGLFEAVEQRPVTLVAELYAGPAPEVELVLPPGYHGLVRAKIDTKEGLSYPPGQRLFSYSVAASGEVSAEGPPLLSHLAPTDFKFRYADGAPLSRQAAESEAGYWWLRSDGLCQVFLVGTKAEYEAQKHAEGGTG